MNVRQKAQLSTEYLVIFVVIIIVSLVVISIMGGFMDSDTDIQSSKAYWRTASVGLMNWRITEGGAASVAVKNNADQPMTVNEIIVDGQNILSSPITLRIGQERTIVGQTTGGEGVYSKDIKIVYSTGGIDDGFTGNVDVKGVYMPGGSISPTTSSANSTQSK